MTSPESLWCAEARKLVGLQASSTGGSAVELAKTKLLWLDAKAKAQNELNGLRAPILHEFPEAKPEIDRILGVLATFDQGLADALDEAYVRDGDARVQARDRIRAIATNYVKFVNSSEHLRLLDENPYAKVGLRDTLSAPLRRIVELV